MRKPGGLILNFQRETTLAWVALSLVLVLNGAALWHELAISRVDLNDNVFHFTLIERMADAIGRGQNPLDCWSAEWTLGYPVLRTYQPLAHLVVVAAWLVLGKTVSLMTVFVWTRYLSLTLLPLSFFACARLIGLRPLAAASAALLAPMVSTNFLYGVEYGSFTWAGSGLFPQQVAANLLLLSLGFGYRAIRGGKHLTLTGLVLGLTFLSHYIYGYIGALSLALLALMPDAELTRAIRIRRMVLVGTASAAFAAFQIAPLLLDRTINHSRWESQWKWDSFGGAQVLKWMFTGELLDHGRLPTLTLLAFGAAGWILWRQFRLHQRNQADAFVLFGSAMWLAMFCGRPLWGPLLEMLGVSQDFQLHRVIGGVHIFMVLLAAIGLAALWGELGSQRRWGTAVIAFVVLLYPMVQERRENLSNDARWGQANLTAFEIAHPSIDATLQRIKDRGGRVYPGLAANWGGQFKIGSVPLHAFLSVAQLPALSFLYHSMALTSDVTVLFDERNPAHYQLFNIKTVVVPAQGGPVLPPFLTPVERIGRFRLLDAPGGGYFEVVDVRAAVTTSRNDFFDVNSRWLASPWVAMHQHLLLDWNGAAPPALARVSPDDPVPPVAPADSAGMILSERITGDTYESEIQSARDCYVLFKMTWHANWRPELDGQPVSAVMLSPGFPGVAVPAGRHRVRFQYRPEKWRAAGAILGILVVCFLAFVEYRSALPKFSISWNLKARQTAQIAAGIVLLALPACIPLFSNQVLDGHDAFEYFPRLTEFHENISNGILLPRWAPDLVHGNGEPFFLFNPPLIYYLGELWHWLGFSFVASMNLTCIVVVLGSAWATFLLGRLYFGNRGGWLAAAALLYAPYFAVDLYVRSAMAEFASFPFLALALYGFGAYAREGKRRALVVGAAGYAGVIFSHHAAALFFTPLLAAFIGFTAWQTGKWRVLGHQALGFVLGLGLGAAAWLPALALRGDIQIDRLLQGYLRYSNHFVYLRQLLYSPWGFGISVPGANDEMSFSLGWSHLLLAAAVWVLATRFSKPADRLWLRFFTASLAVLCILMMPESEWLWDHVRLLKYAQFPWRLLGPAAICLALLVAPLGRILDSFPRFRTPAFAGAMAFLIVPNLSHLTARQMRDVDPAFWTPQRIAARGIEVTTAGEYTPRWIDVSAAPASVLEVGSDVQIRDTRRTPVSWSGQVVANHPSTMQLPISYFPGWRVEMDGHRLNAGLLSPAGQIRFEVPTGEHRVQAAFLRTPLLWTADLISAVTLLLLMILGFAPRGMVAAPLRALRRCFADTSHP